MKKPYFLALAAALLGGATYAGSLTATPTTAYQTIEGIGGAIFMYQDWILGSAQKTSLLDTLFKTSGISILRLVARNNNGMFPADLSGDSTIVAEAYKRNPGLRLMVASWTPPANLKANNSANGTTTLPNTLAPDGKGSFVYDKFGGWWKQTLQKMSAAGIKPTWISFQNELDYNTSYQSCLFDPVENADTSSVLSSNPGFESGLTGWAMQYNNGSVNSTNCPLSLAGPGHSGSGAAQVVVNNSYGASNNWYVQLVLPRVPMVSNAKYQVSFYAKGPAGQIKVFAYDTIHNTLGDGFAANLSGSDWQLVSGYINSGSLLTGQKLRLSLYIAENAGTYLFDDFKVGRPLLAGAGPALKAVSDSIATLPNAPFLLGPEVAGVQGNNLENYAKSVDASRVAAWSFHLYMGDNFDFSNPPSYLPKFDSVASHLKDKPLFMTELYNNSSTVSQTDDFYRLAWLMQEGFTRLNLSAWVYWDLVYENGSMIDFPNQSSFIVKPTFYALSQYARFVKPGWKRIAAAAADSALKTVAFTSAKGDSISIVVVNPWSNSVSSTPVVSGSSSVTGDVWSTTASAGLQKTGTWKAGTALSFPGHSVTTLVAALGPTAIVPFSKAGPSLDARVLQRSLSIKGVGAGVRPSVVLSDALGRSQHLEIRSGKGQWLAALPQGFHGLGLFQVRSGSQFLRLSALVP